MYLLNVLPSNGVITTHRLRVAQDLVGAKDGANLTYTVPSGEKFVNDLPNVTLHLYLNGQRLRILDDFTISESGGLGTGFDTVDFLYVAPVSVDNVSADYAVEVS